jgi:hypothetical protein
VALSNVRRKCAKPEHKQNRLSAVVVMRVIVVFSPSNHLSTFLNASASNI